jgi:hypothetical protein
MKITNFDQINLSKPGQYFTKIGPKEAEILLSRNVENNRKVREQTVRQYATDMVSGNWDESNLDPFRTNEKGEFHDGQHRAWGLIKSGITITAFLVTGQSLGSFDYIDRGIKRTLADDLTFRGLSHARDRSTITPSYLAYQKTNLFENITNNLYVSKLVTRKESIQFNIENEDRLLEALRFGEKCFYKFVKLFPKNKFALLYLILSDIDTSLAEEFLIKLATGQDLYSDHPILHLRNSIINYSNSQAVKWTHNKLFAHIVKAWNIFLVGGKIKALRWDYNKLKNYPTLNLPPKLGS